MCPRLEGPSGLVLAARESPEPGVGEVRIRVEAAGVNYPDVLVTWGRYQNQPRLPFVPGYELCGRVDGLGPGSDPLQKGDRVVAHVPTGAFAEQVVLPSHRAIPVGDSVDPHAAVSLLLTYGTALYALEDRGRLQVSQTVAVLGASGGVGTAAVQVARCLGARVVACVSSREKAELALHNGAHEVVVYGLKPDPGFRDRLREKTGPRGPDVVLDPVGGELTEAALRATAFDGRVLIVGFASGRIPRIPANLALLKGVSLNGVYWGEFMRREPARHRANTLRLLAWLEAGKIRPVIHGRYPFDAATQALQELEFRRAQGKVILVP